MIVILHVYKYKYIKFQYLQAVDWHLVCGQL